MPSPFRDALSAALWGVRYAVRTQRNLRVHLAVALGVCLVSLWLRVRPLEAALLVVLMGMVVTAELFNTSLEALVDAVIPERREAARVVKDVSAAAVLVAALIAVAGGALVLGPALLARLRLTSGWVTPAVLGALALGAAAGLLRLSRAGPPWYDEAEPLPQSEKGERVG
ncbi:MAG: diacylglycerol kinase family protein [Armatimonadota bacterium]|nr:diacylglycerol kinase family protein [Armatimonadota bacterium]